jgi:hypothetical protein
VPPPALSPGRKGPSAVYRPYAKQKGAVNCVKRLLMKYPPSGPDPAPWVATARKVLAPAGSGPCRVGPLGNSGVSPLCSFRRSRSDCGSPLVGRNRPLFAEGASPPQRGGVQRGGSPPSGGGRGGNAPLRREPQGHAPTVSVSTARPFGHARWHRGHGKQSWPWQAEGAQAEGRSASRRRAGRRPECKPKARRPKAGAYPLSASVRRGGRTPRT